MLSEDYQFLYTDMVKFYLLKGVQYIVSQLNVFENYLINIY